MGYVITRDGEPVRFIEPLPGAVINLQPGEDVRAVPIPDRRGTRTRIADALDKLVGLEEERNRLIVVGHDRAAEAEERQAARWASITAETAGEDD